MATPWYYPFKKAFRIACFLVAHLLVASVMIGIVQVIERLLLTEGDPRLFDLMPLRYIFHGMDVVILLIFTICGSADAWRVFRESGDV